MLLLKNYSSLSHSSYFPLQCGANRPKSGLKIYWHSDTMDHVLTADHHMLKDLFRFLISIQNTKTIVTTPLRVPKALPPNEKMLGL